MALFKAVTNVSDESVTLGEGAILAKDQGVINRTNIVNSGGFTIAALAAFGIVLFFYKS